MENTNNKPLPDTVKMGIICNIQAMEKAIGYLDPTCFETLWSSKYADLQRIQDKLIAEYNDVIEARQFAADIIFNRR